MDASALSAFAVRFRHLGKQLLQTSKDDTVHDGSLLPIGGNGDDGDGGDASSDKGSEKLVQEILGYFDVLSDEMMQEILVFTLRPRFLPDYTLKKYSFGAGMSGTGSIYVDWRWEKNDPVARRHAAMEEIKRLGKAFAALRLSSTRFHRLVTDPSFRVRLYRDWLTQPLPPLWLEGKREKPIRAPGHSADAIRNIYGHTVPELDSGAALWYDKEHTGKFYPVLLANIFFNWYLGQYMRDAIKFDLSRVRLLTNRRDATNHVLWDGKIYSKESIRESQLMWPGVESYNTFYMDISSHASLWVKIPGQPVVKFKLKGKIIAEFDHDYGMVEWLGLESTKEGKEAFQNVSPSDYQTSIGVKTVELTAFEKFAIQSVLGISIIRYPLIEIARGTELDRSFGHAQRQDLGADLSTSRHPVIFMWDNPLRWDREHDSTLSALTVPMSRREPATVPPTYIFWPFGFRRFAVDLVQWADPARTGRILSIFGAQNRGMLWESASVLINTTWQSENDNSTMVVYSIPWSKDSDILTVSIFQGYREPNADGLKPVEFTVHSISKAEDVPKFIREHYATIRDFSKDK